MPDMKNAEAAKVLTEMVDALGENNMLRYTKAIRVALNALSALTPKTDENGHALCGCGGKLQYDYYYESDDLNCGETHSISCSNQDCWIEITANSKAEVFKKWDTAMGLRRDA
jgi:hypothetical protein